MIEEKIIAQNYTESLNNHIKYVKEAGRKLGVNSVQLAQHDLSKWTPIEFMPYAVNFYGSDEQKEANKGNFDLAWLHHQQVNPHHWQYWLLVLDAGEVRALFMPKNYALEMVADWMGASMAYTGSWDMTEWLKARYPNIVLHDDTRKYIDVVLSDEGYNLGDIYTSA